MNTDERISDEQLNAFTDAELEADEENRIFKLSEQCPELDARLCQQRKLKELVQHAYRDVPQPYRRDGSGGSRRSLLGLAAAAVLLLTTGLAGGWFAARTVDEQATTAAVSVSQDTWLLHVASADPTRMRLALDRVEELMTAAGASTPRRVEIVANEGGLDLLRSDRTPFAQRIRALAEQDVLFFACSRAIKRLEEQGVRVELVPEADAQYSALDRVVMRLQDGWTYERI